MNERLKRHLQRTDVTRKGARRVSEILEAGAAILLDEGFMSLTKRRIATRLGISHGNVSYYFPTRESLWQAVFEYELQDYYERHHLQDRSLAGNAQLEFDAFILRRIDAYRNRKTRAFFAQVSAFSEVNENILLLRNENYEMLYQHTLARVGALVPHADELALRPRVLAIIALLDGLHAVAVYRPDALVDGDSFPQYLVERANAIARGT